MDIQVVKHPAISPDMNPIESIWTKVKTFVEKKRPTNKAELLDYLNRGWSTISLCEIRRTIGHFKKKVCKAVEEANGRRVDENKFRRSDKLTITPKPMVTLESKRRSKLKRDLKKK